MWSNGINPIMGIIPACQDHFDFKNFSCIRAPIDHYAVIKGTPLGSKGALSRDYTPIHIPNTNLKFHDNPRIVLSNGLSKFNCQMHIGDKKLVEYKCLPGVIEYWVMTANGWAIHDQVI